MQPGRSGAMKRMAGKKVLVLSASPRKGGNSDLLCDRFLLGAGEAGHQAEKICLRERKIEHCTACDACQGNGGKCVHEDDMAGILEKMIGADVIVMATPVWFFSMNGQMKTLIDRTCSRYTEIRNKEFYFIVAAADTSKQAMERTLEGFRGFTSCLSGVKEKGVIYVEKGGGGWLLQPKGAAASSSDRSSAPRTAWASPRSTRASVTTGWPLPWAGARSRRSTWPMPSACS